MFDFMHHLAKADDLLYLFNVDVVFYLQSSFFPLIVLSMFLMTLSYLQT